MKETIEDISVSEIRTKLDTMDRRPYVKSIHEGMLYDFNKGMYHVPYCPKGRGKSYAVSLFRKVLGDKWTVQETFDKDNESIIQWKKL